MDNPSIQRLPSGTVTFLFTDIEGSTKLAREHPETWETLLARHDALLRESIESNNGYVFQTVGDGFCAAFPTAGDALKAAYHAQQALQSEPWGESAVRVRMGIHAGEVEAVDNEYHGYLTLSLVQRLMSVGHGGQVLVSGTTENMVRDQLPKEINLRDMGQHNLKDVPQPVHVFQVVAPDLQSEFPALRTIDLHPHNFPTQVTSFVGREKELAEVKKLLQDTHVLTLTGPGGSGKTRLALQVATEMVEHFQDGVFLVALAPITNPRLVASTIAQSLGITEAAGRSIVDSLKDYLQNKSLLLLLDNFEQVISAAPLVAELLAACSELKILVTSREGLRISGEHEYPVPPLPLPNLTELPTLESLSQYAGVELFLQRARAVKPDFHLTNETAPTIAEICYRLDGLPLAIELAAARIKLLSPRAMLDRLGNRLEFLSGGGRDLPARQQSLRNAIAWSYDLLNENEQNLFRRLSVFTSGCMIDAIEALAEDPLGRISILDELVSLLDKSLLREIDDAHGEPRFVMLELLREFGLEQLAASSEQERIRLWHAKFFLAM